MSPPNIRASDRVAPAPSTLPEKVELAIVGAGFAGLSAALAAESRGMQAVVIEAGTIGSGQSGSCGGQIIAGFESDPSELIRHLGLERARLLMAASMGARDSLARAIADEPHCGLRQGGLVLACGADQDAHLLHESRAMAELGEPSFSIAKGLGAHVGSALYSSGLFVPGTFHANPMAACHALASKARKAGALIIENCKASKLSRKDGMWLLQTDQGPILAGKVFLAGGGSELLAHRLVSPTVLVKTWVAATEELSDSLLASLLPTGACAYDCQELTMDFFRIEGKRLLLGGGDSIAASHARGEAYLRSRIRAIFHQLRDVSIEESWWGMADVSASRLPCLSR